MADAGAVTIRTRKVMANRLLNRKQMIIDVTHPNRPNVPKSELKTALCKQYKVNDEKTVYVFGMRTAFGGQKSTGFALIYDTLEDAYDAEPKYRLIRQGLKKKVQTSRKQRRELKNKRKKIRGAKKGKTGAAAGGGSTAAAAAQKAAEAKAATDVIWWWKSREEEKMVEGKGQG